MEKKISPDLLHNDGLANIQMQIRQFPVDELGRSLYGQEAVVFIAKGLRKIMGYSGVTIEEARATLMGKNGPHLDEVLAAIDQIEEENKQKD